MLRASSTTSKFSFLAKSDVATSWLPETMPEKYPLPPKYPSLNLLEEAPKLMVPLDDDPASKGATIWVPNSTKVGSYKFVNIF